MAKRKGKKPTPEDITLQQQRLRVQYPQMYEEPFIDKNEVIKKLAGDTNLVKMVAKRLKKLYGGK